MRHSFILFAIAGLTHALDSIGCFSELPSDVGSSTSSPFQTPALCSDQCKDTPYVALFGEQCFCLNEVPTEGQISSSACNSTCGGYPTFTCGGENAYEVYVGTGLDIVVDGASSGSSSSSSSSDSESESDPDSEDQLESESPSDSGFFESTSSITDDLEFGSIQIKGTTTEIALLTDSAFFDSDKSSTANLTLHLNVVNSEITSSIISSDSSSVTQTHSSESAKSTSDHSETSKVSSDTATSTTKSSETKIPSSENSTSNTSTTSSNDVGNTKIDKTWMIGGFAALCLSLIIA